MLEERIRRRIEADRAFKWTKPSKPRDMRWLLGKLANRKFMFSKYNFHKLNKNKKALSVCWERGASEVREGNYRR
ncbi:hypothetical protein COE30_18725 [Bacillus cereus]|nr:hypothetical protein COE30_18725 [Bacillus cereus]